MRSPAIDYKTTITTHWNPCVWEGGTLIGGLSQYRGDSIRRSHATRSTPKIEMWTLIYSGPHTRGFCVDLKVKVRKHPCFFGP